VCSNWAAGVISDNNINVDTTVVPLGVDRRIFNVRPKELESTSKREYVFLSCGKYEERKGQAQIVEAFNIAFSHSDKVRLFISMHNQFMGKEELIKIKKSFKETRLGDKISFIGPFNTQQELAVYMNFCDCGVFPSKAEGWGLETLEMMSCGKPVIVSNCSAHTEYCNENNSLLIPVERYCEAYDGIWFHGQGNWAIIETPALVERMREAFKNNINSNPHGIETAEIFSWANTCNKITSSI
jgi:glycosyltransferase involved in cell wall biosynthesis